MNLLSQLTLHELNDQTFYRHFTVCDHCYSLSLPEEALYCDHCYSLSLPEEALYVISRDLIILDSRNIKQLLSVLYQTIWEIFLTSAYSGFIYFKTDWNLRHLVSFLITKARHHVHKLRLKTFVVLQYFCATKKISY